jgi:hypothetical protein
VPREINPDESATSSHRAPDVAEVERGARSPMNRHNGAISMLDFIVTERERPRDPRAAENGCGRAVPAASPLLTAALKASQGRAEAWRAGVGGSTRAVPRLAA